MRELHDKATKFKETGLVHVLDAELTIVKSDTAISSELRDSLRSQVKVLEDVPDSEKDWHPGSHRMVLDLVHPSLFPLIYGVTRIMPTGSVPLDECLNFIGLGVPTDLPQWEGDAEMSWPPMRQHHHLPPLYGKHQWLPTDVELTANGGAVIKSYINNLHPKHHKELYKTLEKIVEAAVPLWEACLSWQSDRRRIKITDSGSYDWILPEGVKYPRAGRSDVGTTPAVDADGDTQVTDAAQGGGEDEWSDMPDEEEEDDMDEDEDDDDYKWTDEYQDWWREHRILTWPTLGTYTPIDESQVWTTSTKARELQSVGQDLRRQFADKGGLQVIFKLANIHLTPQKAVYGGGEWHIEGSLNERICATVLYYYDEDNITDSTLAFRHALDGDHLTMLPEQNEYESLEAWLGIENDGPMVQELGSVLTRQGRMLAFPNIVQHRVGRFELKDRSRPGHRKILAMFLIDPHRRIPSTATCPPQQKDWWAPMIRRQAAEEAAFVAEVEKGVVGQDAKPVTYTKGLGSLPAEVLEQVIDMVDEFPLTWKQAVMYRKKLMAERAKIATHVDEVLMEVCLPFVQPVCCGRDEDTNTPLQETFSFCEH